MSCPGNEAAGQQKIPANNLRGTAPFLPEWTLTAPRIMAKTLYDKLWDDHTVHVEEDGTTLLYIDRHLLHEVTSPQASKA